MDKIFGIVDFNDTNTFSFHDKIKDAFYLHFIGTLHNQQSLQRELELSHDTTIVEILKELYIRHGIDFLPKLDGVFSLVLYDKKGEKLYLVKDRIGIKPFYYYFHNDKLIYGTHLKDFYEVDGFTKKINKEALSVFLNYGYILQPYSIYENTYKIKSGHYLFVDIKKKTDQQKAYWKLESCYSKKKIYREEKTILSDIEMLLHNSIYKRLNGDKPLAASLSGGYDSSTVASMLTNLSGKKIDTFTIGFSQQEINEAPYAKAIAKHIGTNHHEHYFSDEDALSVVPNLCKVYDEPFADYGATPTVLMAQLIKLSGFDDIWVGDGGDEVFATADDVAQFDKLLKLQPLAKKSISNMLNIIKPYKIPYLNKYQNIPTKYYKVLELLNAKTIPQMVKVKPILFFDDEIEALLGKKKILTLTTFDEIDFSPYAESVDQVIGSYFKTSMVDAELVKSYQAFQYANIGIKEPLLDNDLISYMTTVPGDIKIKDDEKKYLLKQIAHTYIPKKLLDRPKSGFNIPFELWLKGPLKELLYAHINEKSLQDDAILDTKTVLDIRDAFYGGNESYSYKLWTLLLFQLWFHDNKS